MKHFSFSLKALMLLSFLSIQNSSSAQCYFSDTTNYADTVSFSAVGCSLQAYGCADIAWDYWMSGTGQSVTVTFVHPQNNPSIRVWGMNSDDSANVNINGSAFPLNATTASYDAKVVCGLSPGPDGVAFANGKLVGANSPADGNYSYQNVTLNAAGVNEIIVSGAGGAGWGFAGVTINCSQPEILHELSNNGFEFNIYPNPANNQLTIESYQLTANTIEIYDVAGRIIYQEQSGTQLSIINRRSAVVDCQLFSPGVYFVKIGGAVKIFIKE